MPEYVALHVEEHSLDGPAESLAKIGRVAGTPVRPWLALVPQWKPCGEEGTMIVGELELVGPLDAGDLGVSQARTDVAPARLGQPSGGLATQLCSSADHPRTVVPAWCGKDSDLAAI
jgi:hypothetical protein